MASYFDLPPQEKAAAANIDGIPEKERKKLGGTSLLSPAVTQLLEDLGDEDSDSDSGERSLSEEGEDHKPVKHDSQKGRSSGKASKSAPLPQKGARSPNSRSSQKLSSARASGGGSSKPKQPHMARFHSLRSMLFTSHVENKMKEVKQEESEKQEAASKWKAQHEQRQMHRPKTPETDAHGKEKLGKRIKTKIRRMTSKDVPTLDTLNEDGAPHDFSDRGSTASSDAEDERPRYLDTDEESINHSDVEDLVRWISRRDPPSDGEARVANKADIVQEVKEDSGHESLGHSDVEDLVRWVSQRSEIPGARKELHTGYSDASTEEDSELEREHPSSEEEDADDLVRWISHRDGPTAGPIRNQRRGVISEMDEHADYDSDVPELGRWVKRHDGTSGESLASTPVHEPELEVEEPERGRPRSRDRPSSREDRRHLTDDDIHDLVRWVSRKDSKHQESPEHDDGLSQLKREEEAKQAAIGMSVDEGSLSHSDVKELISHVHSARISEPFPTVLVSSSPTRHGEGEKGFLRRENTAERDARKFAAQEHLIKSRGESKQIDEKDFTDGIRENGLEEKEELGLEPKRGRNREGSLGQEDVDELVRWVSQKS